MDVVYTLFLAAFGSLWFRDGWDAWKRRRVVRRECSALDLELKMLT